MHCQKSEKCLIKWVHNLVFPPSFSDTQKTYPQEVMPDLDHSESQIGQMVNQSSYHNFQLEKMTLSEPADSDPHRTDASANSSNLSVKLGETWVFEKSFVSVGESVRHNASSLGCGNHLESGMVTSWKYCHTKPPNAPIGIAPEA